MVTFLNPLDAKIPFSFLANFWVWVTSEARGSVSLGFPPPLSIASPVAPASEEDLPPLSRMQCSTHLDPGMNGPVPRATVSAPLRVVGAQCSRAVFRALRIPRQTPKPLRPRDAVPDVRGQTEQGVWLPGISPPVKRQQGMTPGTAAMVSLSCCATPAGLQQQWSRIAV